MTDPTSNALRSTGMTREEQVAFMQGHQERLKGYVERTAAIRATLCYGSRPNLAEPFYDPRSVSDSGDCV